MASPNPIVELRELSKRFGTIIALADVSFALRPGEVHCLLGDNGAGKSTLIRTIAGYHAPTSGQILFEGKSVSFASPNDALDCGIATVYQDLGLVPLMSVTRNFFMGREPCRNFGPVKVLRMREADEIARSELLKIGIDIRDPHQPVGTMSGGERQSLAIARAVYFGAKVLILDEPTSALGVVQTSIVLKYMAQLRRRNIGIIFITHNVRHAFAIGDRFTVLNRGRTLGTFAREEKTRAELEDLMAGGRELADLTAELGVEAQAAL
jgi:simple sugar transport system ATP-binding protein